MPEGLIVIHEINIHVPDSNIQKRNIIIESDLFKMLFSIISCLSIEKKLRIISNENFDDES